MKTGKRSYPLDQLSVSEDGVSVSIHTHRSQIVVSVDDGHKYLQLSQSFDDFFRSISYMLKVDNKTERSRSTGVEEGK